MASSEAAESKTLSTARYKIAAASEEESKLSQALEKHLVPLISKVASPHKAVRDAAFQAYISVNKLIEPQGVILPVLALVHQYKSTGSPIVKQLNLGLIKKGLSRLDQSSRRGLLASVLRSMSKDTNLSNAAGAFNIFLRLLLEVELPSKGTHEDATLRENVGLSDPADARYIADLLGKLCLFTQDMTIKSVSDKPSHPSNPPPRGITHEEIVFFRNNNDEKTWAMNLPGSLVLPECKVKAINFIASGAFTDEERFDAAIRASGSADSRISSVAEDMIKRTSVDLEDKPVAQKLYELHDNLPVPHRIQVLRILSKSKSACNMDLQLVGAVKADLALTSGFNPHVAGREATKLRQGILGFLFSVARNRNRTNVAESDMGADIIWFLQDIIKQQGWPDPSELKNRPLSLDEQRIRANAFEAIGSVARTCQLDSEAKLKLLKWLFDSLLYDPTPDIVVYVESAISGTMGLFKFHKDEHEKLVDLLLDFMKAENGHRTARHIAARFANNVLSYNNIKARWIDIIALSNSVERRDVHEEGQKGLDPWWASQVHSEEPTLILPDWKQLIQFILEQNVESPEQSLKAFPTAVKFIKQMILLTAANTTKVEVDWEARTESSLENDWKFLNKVSYYLHTHDLEPPLDFLRAVLDNLRDHPEVGGEECVQCIADLLPLLPTELLKTLSSRSPELRVLARSNNPKIRQYAAKAFGALAPWDPQSNGPVDTFHDFLRSCQKPGPTQSYEYQGSVAFLAAFYSSSALSGNYPISRESRGPDGLMETITSALAWPEKDMQNTALEAASQLWVAGLGFPDASSQQSACLDVLQKLAKSQNEKAITAIGRFAISRQVDEKTLDSILDTLYGLFDIKETEVHFATGEAIAAVIGRWDSKSVKLSLPVRPLSDENSTAHDLSYRPDRVKACLEKLIIDCRTTKPSLLKASGIWLFCVIEYCSELLEVQTRLRDCQAVFMRLLTAKDELVQETASRGLSLVYEKGDASLRGDLVRDLVSTFTGSKTQLKVDDDTELFDAGALPTGEGKSVTSYKDIVSLANEVGDQTLVYKFMALATNAATWTARSAFGRFGLSNILSDAELDPKIYPKLYRYRFDPNSNVRRSMDDIWKAVVKDSTAVIDTHFDEIMNDLLKSILDGKEWRVREASCAAIADLIQGQSFPRYEQYYTAIWQAALRVLDDQKGSVREAALKLCLRLSKTLVTQLEENNHSSSAKAMVAQVLPFLLSEKGIDSTVMEVKYMAIQTVLDVVKKGGDALKPYVSMIVIQCLGLLGTVEPEKINMYYQRVNEEDREKLDKLRSTAATQSPLFECITDCLRFADEDIMTDLVPQIIRTTRSAIGMQTKVGCAEVLATLAMRHSVLLMPHNASILKTLETQILDRNHQVSKTYTRSAAYLLRAASADAGERFTSRLVELYFAAEDETRRQKIADAVLAIAKVSPDAFTSMESRLLPFAYLGQHDTDSYVSEELAAAWSQHAGGNHTVMRYVGEIVELVSKALDTSKWALQHGSALALASMIMALSSVVGKAGQFGDAHLQRIWPVLDKALALKTFKGKEKLIAEFPKFLQHGKSLRASDPAVAAQTKKIAIREAKRNSDDYRPHAIVALAKFAEVREDIDIHQEVIIVVSPHLAPFSESGGNESSKKDAEESQRKVVAASLKAIMTAYNRPKMQKDSLAVFETIIVSIEGAKEATATAKDVWYNCTAELLEAAAAANPDSIFCSQASTLAMRLFRLLVADAGDAIIESQRAARAKAIGQFFKARDRGVFGKSLNGMFDEEARNSLQELRKGERSLDVLKLMDGWEKHDL